MKDTGIMLPTFEGYEYTGEYRIATEDDFYLSDGYVFAGPSFCTYPILKKKTKRLSEGSSYWTIWYDIESGNSSIDSLVDDHSEFDDTCFNTGNYFLTLSQAQTALKAIKEVFYENRNYLMA